MFLSGSGSAHLRGIGIRCTRNVKLLTRLYRGVALSRFDIYLHNSGSPHCFAARTSTARFSDYQKGVSSHGKLCRKVVSSTVGMRNACLGVGRHLSSRAIVTQCVRPRTCKFR